MTKCNLLIVFVVCSFFLKSEASEKDVYDFSWLDPDKEVYVLQNRKFRKKENATIHFGGGITTSGAFINSTSLQARFNYFFGEELGVEFLYAKNYGKENEAALLAQTSGPQGTGTIPFRRITKNYTGAYVLWSPFYSKINTFNKIVYMDWIMGLGVVSLAEDNNKLAFRSASLRNTVSSESHLGLSWQASMKFYVSEHWNIRADLTAGHFNVEKASGDGKTLFSNYDATLSLGYTF